MRSMLAAIIFAGCYAPAPTPGSPCPDFICPTGLVCSPLTMTCERNAVSPRDAEVDTVEDGAMPPAYRYRSRLSIQNTSAAALPAGFTIRVPLGPVLGNLVEQGKVKADLSDLRVIGDGAIGERDRIVDPVAGPTPAAVSFALDAPIAAGATSTDYALYYGATGDTPVPADGSAVFAVYDNFTSGISSKWLINDAPITSGGSLVLRAGRSDALATNAASDGLPVISAVEVFARVTDPTSNPTTLPEGTFYYWFGYQRTGDFVPSAPWILWVARAKSQIRGEQNSPVGCEAECIGPSAAQATAKHVYAIERDPGETRFYRDGALSFTAAVTNQADYSVMVRNFLATSDVVIDWIRARARVTPDPTVSLGAEEAL